MNYILKIGRKKGINSLTKLTSLDLYDMEFLSRLEWVIIKVKTRRKKSLQGDQLQKFFKKHRINTYL